MSNKNKDHRQQKKTAKKLKREKIRSKSNKDHRQQKKAAKKLKREKIRKESDRRKVRNSRAARLHQVVRRPGRGGLSALGAEQLRKYFSTESSQDEKLSIGAMDPTATMTVLQMAAEELDAAEMTYGELRKVAEENIMGCEGGEREAAVDGGEGQVEEVAQGEQAIMACEGGEREAAVKGENGEIEGFAQGERAMEAEGDVESEDEEMGEEDWEEGGVALAKDY